MTQVPLHAMKRRLFAGVLAAAVGTVALAAPAFAHGDHDARPLARDLAAGPYRISLWQVFPDAGDATAPHLIVLFDGRSAAPAEATISVAVNATPMSVVRSTTTPNGWESVAGVTAYDVVMITVSEGSESWSLDPVVVAPAPTSLLPMRELLWTAIGLTAVAALWMLGRTARTWRPPALEAG